MYSRLPSLAVSPHQTDRFCPALVSADFPALRCKRFELPRWVQGTQRLLLHLLCLQTPPIATSSLRTPFPSGAGHTHEMLTLQSCRRCKRFTATAADHGHTGSCVHLAGFRSSSNLHLKGVSAINPPGSEAEGERREQDCVSTESRFQLNSLLPTRHLVIL